jgi:hypothetical protein
MKGLPRFICFVVPFLICMDVAYKLDSALGSLLAGVWFAIAYHYGEKQ